MAAFREFTRPGSPAAHAVQTLRRRLSAPNVLPFSRPSSAEYSEGGITVVEPHVSSEAQDTAMNPAVLTAFALATVADGQGPAYPRIPGHEPDVFKARTAAKAIDECVEQLRAVAGENGLYVNETNYFEKDWQQAFWGDNYSRLAEIKQKYDPDGLFFVHNGVGSEGWSRDGFTRV